MPWRLQELAETEVGELGDDGPVYGRQYRIVYNREIVGQVAIRAGFEYKDRGGSSVHLSIERARLFRSDEITDFVVWLIDIIAVATKCPNRGQLRKDTEQKLLLAMVEAMWKAGPDAIHNPELDLYFQVPGRMAEDES